MDSRTQVLLYLKRNENVSVSHSGKIITKRSDSELNVSRGSSVASGRSSNNSRSSTPTSYSSTHKRVESSTRKVKILSKKSETFDPVASKLKNSVQELVECQILKDRVYKKYEKEEQNLVKYLNELIEIERKRIRVKTDHSYNPTFRREAENIAQKEKIVEDLAKNNKALKTLLAELTLNEVDSRISVSLDKKTKSDNLSIILYLKKFANMWEGPRQDEVLLRLKERKKVVFDDKSLSYSEKIKNTAEFFVNENNFDTNFMCKLLCNEIVGEQESRLLSEEAADNCIFEKEKKIKQLEESVQKLSAKYK